MRRSLAAAEFWRRVQIAGRLKIEDGCVRRAVAPEWIVAMLTGGPDCAQPTQPRLRESLELRV